MNSKIAIEMQNTFGRFIQLYHLNRLDLADSLFAESAHLWLPDRGIDAEGIDSVRCALKQLQETRIALGSHRDIHLPHTPAYDTTEYDSVGLATWDIHTFEFANTKDGRDAVEYIYGRVDAKFVNESGVWKFAELDWWDVGSFVPWDYNEEEDDGLRTSPHVFSLPPAFSGKTTVRDFYAIQNVITRFAHNNRKYAMEDAFANRDDISYRAMPVSPETARGRAGVAAALERMNEMERINLGKYVYVPATSAPVIEVCEDGQSAHGQWMASCYTVEGEAFGIQGIPYRFIRRAAILKASFVKENGQWKIKDYDVNILMAMPAIEYDSTCMPINPTEGMRYQRMGLSENRWKPALPKMGGDFPDDLPYLESFPARWVNAYRRGEYVEFLKKNVFNDEHDVYFHSRARGRNASQIIGSEAMLEFFSMGVFHYHHQQITNHGGVAPDIEISADGRYATISLFDMNSTAYDPAKNRSDGNENGLTLNVDADWNADNSGYEHTPSRFQFSVYQFSMAKVDGVWKIIHVDWETVGSLPDQKLAGKRSRGWAGSITDLKYPKLFEKYQFSPKRKIEDARW